LLNALLDRIFSDSELYSGDDPIAELRHLAWTFRAVGLRYPQFFSHFVLQHRFNTETTLALLERMTSACLRIARDEHDMALFFRTFVHFLMGALLDETSGYAVGPGAENPPSEAVMRERFPHVLLLAPHNEASHHEENFKFGLELVLQAIAQRCS
jgi:hypothetical protein